MSALGNKGIAALHVLLIWAHVRTPASIYTHHAW